MENNRSKLLAYHRDVLKRGFDAWVFVTVLLIPAMLLTRVLLYFDLLPYVAVVFEPLMSLVGLPPEAALVWVSSFLANTYVGVAVFISLLPVMEGLTLAQATTLTCMILLAHSLTVEGQICRGTGVSFWRVTVFRLLSAIVLGLIIHGTALATGWGHEPVVVAPVIAELAGSAVPPWGEWLLSSIEQIFLILVLVIVLMFGMEFIKYIGLTRLIMKLLGPPLRLAGVGENALMVTIIGCVVGLGYGGGLIIAESRASKLSADDIFGSMMLMAIFHSLFEDTIVMWAMGGSLWWLLGARLVFALALVAVITRLARRPGLRSAFLGPKLASLDAQ